jgi:polysaccharide biosynthesis protein PslH
MTRVFYFTIVDIGRQDNGGGLVCRNHAKRLASVPGVKLTLCAAGPETQFAGIQAFANDVSATLQFIPLRQSPPASVSRWPFFHEVQAASHRGVDKELLRLIQTEQPRVLVVDYVPSAMFIPSAYEVRDISRITITLNPEIRFFRDLQRKSANGADFSGSSIARLRLAIHQQWYFSRSAAIVALTKADLGPLSLLPKSNVIQPVFDSVERKWTGKNRRDILFVGNIGHYPNRDAVEWICTKLSSSLLAIDPGISIRVIGAEAGNVPAGWRRPNVDFLGVGDAALVDHELCETGLFIAPISNPFGSKIKLLDCLARGTPFAATKQALSGLSQLSAVPLMRLDDPNRSAQTIRHHLDNGGGTISEKLQLELNDRLSRQQAAWNLLIGSLANPVGPRSPRRVPTGAVADQL